VPAHPDRRARAGHGGAGRMPLYGRYGSRPRRPARTAPRPWGACPCGSSPGCGGIRLRSREKGGPDGPSDRIRPAGGELGAPLSTGYPDPSRVQPPAGWAPRSGGPPGCAWQCARSHSPSRTQAPATPGNGQPVSPVLDCAANYRAQLRCQPCPDHEKYQVPAARTGFASRDGGARPGETEKSCDQSL